MRRIQDAQAYRAQKVADAEGESQRFTQLLTEYERAPAVTRERLYLETIETVLQSSKKVVIDTEGNGSGNLIYLPTRSATRSGAPYATQRWDGLEHDHRAAGDRLECDQSRSADARITLMANRALILLLAIIAGIFVISLSAFSVRETELAIKFQLRSDRARQLPSPVCIS